MDRQLRCSSCGEMKDEEAFSPKRWIYSHYWTTDGKRHPTKAPCKRGRHYHCNRCRYLNVRDRQ